MLAAYLGCLFTTYHITKRPLKTEAVLIFIADFYQSFLLIFQSKYQVVII